nr:hypothetical protein [Tanacetum cinerariifolium]
MYSYVIRLNFYAFEDSMDSEALLVGLVASADRGIKDLHIFMDSKILVDQVEGSRILRTKKQRSIGRKSWMPRPHFIELLNQEVKMGIKTMPTVEAVDKDLREGRNEAKKATAEKLKSTWGGNSESK